MVRWLTRVGLLRMQGTIYDCSEPEPFAGSIEDILEKYRQCPSYQINKHHSHCGIRGRLGSIVSLLHRCLNTQAGVCGNCWVKGRDGVKWSEHGRVEQWEWNPVRLFGTGGFEQHERAIEMFIAEERDWEPYST